MTRSSSTGSPSFPPFIPEEAGARRGAAVVTTAVLIVVVLRSRRVAAAALTLTWAGVFVPALTARFDSGSVGVRGVRLLSDGYPRALGIGRNRALRVDVDTDLGPLRLDHVLVRGFDAAATVQSDR